MTGHRLAVFAQPRSFMSNLLVGAVIEHCRSRPDVELVAVFDTARGDPHPWPLPRAAAAAVTKRLFDAAHPMVLHAPMWRTFHRDARRARVPIIKAPRVNDPAFVEVVQRDLRADFALSLVCLQIFGPELLASFAAAVNFHNGLLPAYRGVHATDWSIYNGEVQSGFTFHHMTSGIDEGPVLHEGVVPVGTHARVTQVDWQKAALAAGSIPRVVNAMIAADPGVPQSDSARYYSVADAKRVVTVGDASSVSWDDLVRRIRAFGAVEMTLAGRKLRVTRVETSRAHRLGFRTVDGVTGRATRLRYLPPALYRLSRSVAAARPS